MTREEQIRAMYHVVSTSAVHKDYSERVKIVRGWSGQKIAGKLRKAVRFYIDHPNYNFAYVYAGAFGLNIDGYTPDDMTEWID